MIKLGPAGPVRCEFDHRPHSGVSLITCRVWFELVSGGRSQGLVRSGVSFTGPVSSGVTLITQAPAGVRPISGVALMTGV